MHVRLIIKWILIIGIELGGICLLIAANIQYKEARYNFKVIHLLKNIPIYQSSGTQLLIEGVSCMILGLLMYFFAY